MSPRRRGRGRGNGTGEARAVDPAANAESPSAIDAPAGQAGLPSSRALAVPAAAQRPSGGSRSGRGPERGGNAPRNGAPRRPDRIAPPGAASPAEVAAADGGDDGGSPQSAGPRTSTCTLAQMRRFIKSRPYVPVHELRRRFLIEGIEDEVSSVVTGQRTLYVGLPPREAQFLGELVRGGEVGCEVLLDPTSPGIVGVYPMRPVARQ